MDNFVPANTDERTAAVAVIDYLSYCDIFADEGFWGPKWQTHIFDQTNNLIWTPRRANQKYQNSPDLDCWLGKIREQLEGVFHETEDGSEPGVIVGKNGVGVDHASITKMIAHLLRHLLSN